MSVGGLGVGGVTQNSGVERQCDTIPNQIVLSIHETSVL